MKTLVNGKSTFLYSLFLIFVSKRVRNLGYAASMNMRGVGVVGNT